MPTDEASRTVVVDAPQDRVLATLRDVAHQPDWVEEITKVEVLETGADGFPAVARVTAAAPVGTDEYTLAYEHRDDGMSWTLVKGRLQTGQDAAYTLRAVDPGSTEVRFDLRISHNLPLPGFLRRKVIGDLVDHNVTGLQRHLEGGG
ncbi:MAG TPA: SRPBCC family protein [Candidatus Nanopelagicales bacterium]|nr:SRPBCC family protein [Candidatus Nanopelagicales bacterium]